MATHRQRHDSNELALCSALDKLDEFRQYERDILPLLRLAIAEKWSVPEMRKKMAALHQALVIHAALGGNLAALQDALNRHEGCSTRRVIKDSGPKSTRTEIVDLLLKKLESAGKTR